MAQTGVPAWSQTAAANANADPAVNWQEGMAPSAVNDSARASMASVAKYRDDTAGLLITGGTSTAYTLTSNTGFFSKSTMNGAEIAVTIHTTNGASPTLNVDGLGADPIIIDTVSSTTPVPSATLLTGGVYTLVYYSSGNTWRLKDFYQLPFTVPIGGLVDFIGPAVPSSNFVFPVGQAISRATYVTLFGLVGTTYGTGDGSTTFNVPDLRGRVIAGKDDMGGSAASRLTSTYFGTGATTLGGVGSSGESTTLVTGNLPPYTPTGTVAGTVNILYRQSNALDGLNNNYLNDIGPTGSVNRNLSATFTGTAQGGTSTPIRVVQPTMILNKLLRVI
ncbi:tail fiber protein [Bradyrhizobium sp. 4]|uniref:tail fiber protein n=1 Tax=unclassified Bradyrhizobium TaxID=2631580 RepID=UPI001FF7B189|nr:MULTISPECIES: tail fiber protein [unclassified Bradyrhizobium]MCK1400109.1 tail fiber protein [Bradyrhizobium sp. 39]MCK1750399.1 tail fiber protein [Bradyrhizobium sp. 135]UPJ32008.1 tail fiber protein [Bradyrhizobium sp. 4]